jgi:hypothetical protein
MPYRENRLQGGGGKSLKLLGWWLERGCLGEDSLDLPLTVTSHLLKSREDSLIS